MAKVGSVSERSQWRDGPVNRAANTPGSCAEYEEAPDTPTGCGSSNGGHFVGQISELGPTVRHEIDDLNHGTLRPAEARQMDIDGPGSICEWIDCQLGLRRPIAAARQFDDQLLTAKVLDITRKIGAGTCLNERGQLRADGCRTAGQCFKGGGASEAALDPAPRRLRDAGSVSSLGLRQSKGQA
jgi:hypothetical protein